MTPVYPYLVAGVFKLFGTYTKLSAIVLLSLNALMSALACVLVFLIARISFGDRVAKWSGWAWAFCPYAIYFPVERIWETWLATLLLCLIFLITLDLENENKFRKWALFGLLWGLAALTSPALLSVLPFLAGWVIYRRHRRGQRWFAVNAVAAIVFIAVISPWFIRNYEVFHRVVPFRDNMGIVLRLGTKGNTSYWGALRAWALGTTSRNGMNSSNSANSDTWTRKSGRRSSSFAPIPAGTPGPRCAAPFTCGLATGASIAPISPRSHSIRPTSCSAPRSPSLRFSACGARCGRIGRATLPYALVLFSFPLIYYITSPEVYYRRPIDPFFVILAVVAVLKSGESGRV